MKKTIAALLTACMLLFACSSALADVLSFGDFSMDIDPEMAYQYNEKANNAVWFTLYPAYNENGDAATNFNVVWTDSSADFTGWTGSDVDEFVELMRAKYIEGYEEAGVEVTDLKVLDKGLVTLDEKLALVIFMVVTIQYSGMEISAYQLQAVVPDASLGTYTFTGSAADEETMYAYLVPLFNAITWN